MNQVIYHMHDFICKLDVVVSNYQLAVLLPLLNINFVQAEGVDISSFFDDHIDEIGKDLDIDALCHHLTQEHIGVTCLSDLYDARQSSQVLSGSGESMYFVNETIILMTIIAILMYSEHVK